MKKNLIFGMFLLGIVLMSSFAFAGITGYALQLQRGETVTDDNLGTTTVTAISRTGVVEVEVTSPETGARETLFGTAGDILTTSSGAQFRVRSAESGGLFRRATTKIDVLPSVARIASGAGNVAQNVLCNICTKKYQLLEGETNVVDGNSFSINYIDADSSVLSVNGGYTSDLLAGQAFIINGEVMTLTEINPPVGLGVGSVKFCFSGCHQLLEGETNVVDGNSFSINYIDADSSVLSVNGGYTSDLLAGQTFIINGEVMTLTEINPPVGLGVGSVKFCSSSSY